MSELMVGDIVARKSYGCDIYFKVVDIKKNGSETVVHLKGICYRIEADAPESDLTKLSPQHVEDYTTRVMRTIDKKEKEISTRLKKSSTASPLSRGRLRGDSPEEQMRKFTSPGRVLHIDGDNEYMQTCVKQYQKFGIYVVGKYVPEKEQPNVIYKLLQDYKPDILVLTGHDGYLKNGDPGYSSVENYRNSKYFIQAVKEARRYERDLDSLVIFAGACQSMYKSIIDAGANFASSPKRILIHALDPVYICQKIAFTGVDKVLGATEVVSDTITGSEGIGGIQTRGKLREGYPDEVYKS